jgi:hypothetical protein
MKIKGKLKLITNERSGTSTNGNSWRNLTMVITTDATYNPDIAFTIGNKIYDDVKRIAIGGNVEVEYNLKSREWQGKWFTDVEAWKVTSEDKVSNIGGKASDASDMPF